MVKKFLSSLLSISIAFSTTFLVGPKIISVDAETAENVNLDVQDSSISLQTGNENCKFTKDSSGTWGVDGIYVGGVKTASADAQSTNLAIGKSCMASSTDELLGSSCISYATDTDPNSYWQSDRFDTAGPAWLFVDLGEAYLVNKVVLKVPSGWESRTQTLSVETSTDATTWTTAVVSATYTFDPGASNSVAIDFATVSAEYVRISFTANSQATGGQISQLEVYSSSADAQSTNFAVGKSCTASSTDELLGSSCIPYATDTDPNSYWQSDRFDTAGPAWFSVDLGEAYLVNKVVLKVPSGWESRTQTLSVETSTDATTWTTAVVSATYTFDPGASNSVAIDFATVSAEYVRISFTANSQATGGQISQLEVYQDVPSNGGFFNGSSRATAFNVISNDGDTRAIQFTGNMNGTDWTATYTVNATDSLPAYHISFTGFSSNTVLYRTVNADKNQSGTWITRGVIAADAENRDWTYFDGNGPVVFGHSQAGGVDAAYVIMPKVNPNDTTENGKSEIKTSTYFKSGREDAGDGSSYYGFWEIQMGVSEPQEYTIVFDRDLGGRVYQVCEKYYAEVVKTLGTIDTLSVNPIKGDTALTYDPIQLSNPEFYVPGFGWQSYEANMDLGYPHTDAALSDQEAVALYYEGLATGRDWEKNYGAWIMETMKLRATDSVQYKNITDINGNTYTSVPYTNGEYIDKGENGWARFAQSVRPSLGFLLGRVSPSGNQWDLSIASHDDEWVSMSLMDYGLISGNQDITNLGLDNIKYDQNVKFQWDTMDYPAGDYDSWNPITDQEIQTDWPRSDEATAAFAYWLEVRYQQTDDTTSLADADKIIDWISTPMRNETRMDMFPYPGRNDTGDSTFWGASSIGRFVSALLDKYDRSDDVSYKDAALDLAWDGILLYGITPAYAGVSLAANRYGVDFDCYPNLMFEQDLAIVSMAGKLLDYVSGDSYGTFFTLFRAGPIQDFKDDNGTPLTNTVYSGGTYDSEPRMLSNLMFALNKSSDDQVITVEKLVSKLNPNVNQQRDLLVANATSEDRTPTIQIRYLKPGTYTLIVDGISQGTRTAQQLSDGISLSMPGNTVKTIQVTSVSLDSVTSPQNTYDSSTTYLSSINDAGATRVIGASVNYTKDTSWGGNTINLGGTTYSKGIGMCDSTAVFYNLNGSYKTFKATVGVDNEAVNAANPAPTLSFRVFVDGVLKFDSGTMDKNSSKIDISVDVANAQQLVLQLTNNYDDNGDGSNDHGDWANARLEGFVS